MSSNPQTTPEINDLIFYKAQTIPRIPSWPPLRKKLNKSGSVPSTTSLPTLTWNQKTSESSSSIVTYSTPTFLFPSFLLSRLIRLELNNIQQKSSNLEYQSHPQSKTRMHNPKNKNEWSQNVEKLTQNEPLNFSIRIQSNFLPYFLPLPPSLARSNSQCTWHPCAPQCLQRVCQARDLASKFVTT